MINTGRVTLALDDLLCRLTPDQAAAIRETVPPWLLDQANAASAEIFGNLKAAEDAGIFEGIAASPAAHHPDWVRLGLVDTLVTWWCRKHNACMHDPHPMRPQPIHAAAWRPDLVVCRACVHLLNIPRGSETDRTCDGCGRVTAGLDAGDPIYPFVVSGGILAYLVGACGDCRYWEPS